MEHPKFKFEQKVAFLHENEITHAHIRTVYSPSQRKKLESDYCIILKNGEEIDVKEEQLEVA